MREGSLVEWNGTPQDNVEEGAVLLEKGHVYTIEEIRPFYGYTYMKLDHNSKCWYMDELLVEIQPPDAVDIGKLLTEPVYV
jgi:hypothetical protein